MSTWGAATPAPPDPDDAVIPIAATPAVLADADRAIADIRRAAELLDRVRAIGLRIQVSWWQVDHLDDAAVDDLKQRLTAASAAWAAELDVTPVQVTVKVIDEQAIPIRDEILCRLPRSGLLQP